MSKMMRKIMKGEEGFTLVELLVVVIIIAILSAIAIPIYVGQREKAQDAAARSLVRNAVPAVEAYYADNRSYAGATAASLQAIEPSISWQLQTSTVSAGAKAGTLAKNSKVDFFVNSDSVMEIATLSDSGTSFGVKIDKNASITYYKGATGSTSW